MLQVLRQHLAQRHASAQAHGIARNATALARAFGKLGDGLCGLVLHELAHVVADHAHADLLVQNLLQLFGQRHVLHRHAFELQADLLQRGRKVLAQRIGKHHLVGSQVEERHTAGRNRRADVLQDQTAQLAVQVVHRIGIARARDLGVEQLRVRHAVGVVAERAQAHHAEILVADGNGLRRAPLLVDLLARAEEVHIALEGRLEQLVPVLQVGQDGQRLRSQLVGAGHEHIGHLALVDEHRQLRLAHHQRAAVLDFHVAHGVAPRERSIVLLSPLNDVNKLFLDEVHECHETLPL
ncbi:hypothetical protein SDC9_84258 [bioreactor metagenome]|uniref:Uncharacterized protein n=1 Tax=bioreactor metagenome TaxID=1076179 RepID=A0A644Z9S0_9ZZZZ